MGEFTNENNIIVNIAEYEKKSKSSKKQKRRRRRKNKRKNKKSKSTKPKGPDKVIEEVKKLKEEMVKGMQSKTGIMTTMSAYLAHILKSIQEQSVNLGTIQKQLYRQGNFNLLKC